MTRCSSEISAETDPPGGPRTCRPVGSGLGFGVRGPDLVPIGADRHEDTEAFAGEGIDEEFPPVAGLHHQTPVRAYSSVPTLTASAERRNRTSDLRVISTTLSTTELPRRAAVARALGR